MRDKEISAEFNFIVNNSKVCLNNPKNVLRSRLNI